MKKGEVLSSNRSLTTKMTTVADIGGIQQITGIRFFNGKWFREPVWVPDELSLTISINGEELVTILCTPLKLNCLVIGFLYFENIITSVSQVMSLRLCEDESLADVKLNQTEHPLPQRHIVTSGCGSGISFQTQGQKVESALSVAPATVSSLMKQLQQQAQLFRTSGGVHTSALADTKKLLVVTEDIGRHNTLDKIQGECLLRRLATKDRLLLTTGRISSEMLLKAARMQTPIVASRSTPTARAISLAHNLGITLIGYARGSRLSVYSGEERLLGAGS